MNPAARGGAGIFASGCQASERSPFQKAVFSACSAMNLPVPRNEISNFAKAHASANSRLKKEFNPTDLEAAKQLFERTYRSQPRIQLSRNPDNLFGKLMKEGKNMGVEHNLLIDYLKWYTTNRVSPDIAENPRFDDVIQGIAEMTRDISPGGIIFQNILRDGISCETLGESGFFKLNQMKERPQAGHVWAIPSCPPLDTLLDALCIKRAGPCENIVCSISGLSIKPNGEISAFKLFLPKQHHVIEFPKRTHMEGYPAIIWSTNVSVYKLNQIQSYVDPEFVNERIYGRNADGEIDFEPGVCVGPGQLNEYAGDGKMAFINTEQDMQNELHDMVFSQTVALKPTYAENLGPDNSYIREIPEYQNACNTNLSKFGAVSLRLCLESSVALASEASEAVLSKSDHDEETTRDCKHGKWGGGQVPGKCKDCDWGM